MSWTVLLTQLSVHLLLLKRANIHQIFQNIWHLEYTTGCHLLLMHTDFQTMALSVSEVRVLVV